jgi:chromosome segregation ATPase
MVRQVNY